MKAFVLEDHPIDRKLWRALLEAHGYEAIAWGSAEGALERIRQAHPDVLLLDLNLAGFNGLDLVRAMRAAWDMKRIPVLAVTAYAQRYSHADAVEAGCSLMLMKPVDTRRLILEMQSLCEGRAQGPADEHPDRR